MVTRSRSRIPSSTRKKRSSKKKKFQYHKRSEAQYNKASSESSGNWDSYLVDGISVFKPQDGGNQVRPLPPTFPDYNDFAMTLHVHYGIGPDSATYLCRKMLGDDEECAICDEHKRLSKDGDEDANQFKAKKRKAFWLIDRKGDNKTTPLLWSSPFGTWQDIMVMCKDEDGEITYPDDPEEGCDILFTKEGTGQRTRYTGIRLGKTRPLMKEEDAQDEVLEYVQEHPINEILNFYDNDYLEGVLEGTVSKSDEDDDDDDEEDDDERPSRSRKRRSSKKTSSKRRRSRRQEEEDDDDDDDEDEDEDDEDDLDDDEEDEDESDEDEDEDEDEDDDGDDEEEDEEDDEDDEDEDEEESRPKRSRSKKGSSRLRSAASRSRKRTAKKTSTRRRSR